ncbi:alpha/beta hydrolase [Thermomonas carbonis]|uniref:alpha/beta hydrolase n=1 Tax=Thermomonas carbonis TaxID=1463158 RepID=UPI001E5C6179|nr:alpha/beta hydrolase-fold protein [Thermomonas carbonis]
MPACCRLYASLDCIRSPELKMHGQFEAKRLARFLIVVLLAGGWLAGCAKSVAETRPRYASFTLASEVLDEVRRINVYAPSDRQAGRRYPVIYMPDGGVVEDFPHVANTIDTAIRQGEMAPVILVGIENTQRRRDMTGPTTVDEDRKIAAVVGGSAAFRRFIERELIPYVEGMYPGSGQRGIIGESAAGLFVVETLFASPGMFDTYIALDPSLWWNAGKLVSDAPAWLAAHPDISARLYVAWAEPDMIGPHTRSLERALVAASPRHLAWQVVARPDLTHQTIYRAMAPVVLPALYPPN